MKIKDAILQHNKELVGIRSTNTIRTYQNSLLHLLEYLSENGIDGSSPIEKVTPECFIDFPSWLGSMSFSKKTTGAYLAGIKSFMDWLLIKGILDMSYSEGVRWTSIVRRINHKREDRLPRWPKRDDTEKMIAAVKSMPEPAPRLERNIALILFLESTGCRNDEVAKLKLGSVNLKERSAVVVGKGSKERRVFFSPAAYDAIIKYLDVRKIDRNDLAPLFARHDRGAGRKTKPITTATIRDVVKVVSDLAGVKPFSPHYFRHAFAIKMLQQTHDLAFVQDLLGHASPASTRVYAKIYAEDLQAAYRKVNG